MNRKYFFISPMICIIISFFLSCSFIGKKTEADIHDSENFSAPMSLKSATVGNSRNIEPPTQMLYESVDSSNELERKISKSGSLSFEVNNLSDSEKKIETWANSFNGYITDSWANRSSISVTVKIPQSSFDQAMSESGSFGKLLSRSISTEDVSEQYYDLTTRLETRKILKEKLESYLKTATSTSDLLEIESQLNDVLADIESMERQFRQLSNRVDYSTINIEVRLPSKTTESGPDRPQIISALSELGQNTLFFLAGLLLVILYTIIFGTPAILIIALFYWICFGKIGLVRKLFIHLSNRK